MLANQSDFMAYASALKSNYRKGVHRLETILSNPTHAAEFAANLGGVSVVLGVPVNLPDRNSDKLLELLLGSDVVDDAVETWLHQFYEFTGWDDLLSDSARCKEMANNPLIWRAAGGSKLAVGKSIATLAGLSCAAYKDIDAVAASQVAMAAVIGNATALNAVVTSSVAMAAVAASQVAMAAIQKSQTALSAIAASSMATAKYAAGAAGLNPADYADMTAIAASQVAMAAIVKSPVAMAAMWRSDTAIKALQANATAWKTFTGATSAVMGKTVAILANLDPSGYADMTAVAASQVAMAAVAASNTATKAIAASQAALNAIASSTTALDALYAKKSRLTGASASKSGKFIILEISANSAFDTSRYGYATLSDGSQPNWQDYKSKYTYFKQFKKIATYIKNDTEGDDWIDYFPCG
nr:MAG TPA: Tail fiber protein [Caudoviricetes sp.]